MLIEVCKIVPKVKPPGNKDSPVFPIPKITGKYNGKPFEFNF